ncbi:MAG: hypothetical protein ABSB41_08345 [Anaerolineales bacterium]|jgi:hypothetical protein
MSVLHRIACLRDHRGPVSNQELARDLAARHDWAGIREIASNHWNQDPVVQVGRLMKAIRGTGGG